MEPHTATIGSTPGLLVVADDEPDQRALVRRVLGSLFPEVAEVGDGRELFWTMQHSVERAYVVVVTDVWMPAYDGLTVLEACVESGWAHPIIVTTAAPSIDVARRVERLGATLLPKPYSVRELFRVVDLTLARGRESRPA